MAQQTAVGPARAGLACEACRLRKSRCVGFPMCTLCQQRNQPCIRDRSQQTSPLDSWGLQILDAVSAAKKEILSATAALSVLNAAAPQSPTPASAALVVAQQPRRDCIVSAPSHDPKCVGRVPSAESILEWDVLRAHLSVLPAEVANAVDAYEPERSIPSKASADTSLIGLQGLTQRFERKFLVRHPIVSRVRLHRYVKQVAESGGDWNAETCLVFLVSALASLCDCSVADGSHGPQTAARSPFSTISTTSAVWGTVGVARSNQSAYQYWTMAKRRLGWSLEIPTGLLPAQCLCLAGFWHLQNCAPRKACIMFHRAADSFRHQDPYSTISETEKPLARLVHLVCADQIQRLQVELGLCSPSTQSVAATKPAFYSSDAWNRAAPPLDSGTLVADPPPDLSSDMNVYLQQLLDVRTDINQILASTISISSWRELYALCGQIADCRSRLDELAGKSIRSESTPPWLQPQQDEEVASEDVRRRELATLLRACLYLHLSPHLLQMLINTSPVVHSHERILNEAAALAVECITLTVQILRSQLEKWQDEDPASTQRSTPQSAASSPCHHLEAWFSHRFAYAGCLLLLAVHFAKARAFRGEIEYAHCRTLTLPPEWRYLIAGHARLLLECDEGSNLWKGGKLLSRFNVV